MAGGRSSKGNEDDLENKLLNDIINPSEIPNDQLIEDIFLERKTQHADDAVDYEDIDELADDEDLPEEEEPSGKGGIDGSNGDELNPESDNEEELQEQANAEFDDMFGNGDDVFDNDNTDINNNLFNDLGGGDHYINGNDDGLDDLDMGEIFEVKQEFPSRKRSSISEEDRIKKKKKLQRIVKRLESKQAKRNISRYFPTYSRHKPFNFHLFFQPQPRYYRNHRPTLAFKEVIKPLMPTKINLDLDFDSKKQFKSGKHIPSIIPKEKGITQITQNDLDFIKALNFKRTQKETFLRQEPILNKDWKSSDKFTDFSKDLILSTADWDDEAIINAGDNGPAKLIPSMDTNMLDLSSDEDDEYIFDGKLTSDVINLDMNDPNLLLVPQKKLKSQSRALIPINDKQLDLKFNISNDKQYDILKDNYNTKVRSQLSNLNIEHSIPALRLQGPYYKVKLTKQEARSFHRPRFIIRPGSLLSFAKLKQRKKKKDKGKSSKEIFSRTTDLTVADNAQIFGFEYSEEYPSILSNFGMGSKIINYYRKEREDDTSRPKTSVGETHVLGVEDRSPFWNFGEVAPGDFVPTLYNNMVRAPIFKHEIKNTDFLLVRSQGAGSHQRYFLRAINNIFAVGNIFPAVEVPAPHSRKVTNTSKNRLKMVVFRVMNNNGQARISVKDVSKHFPDQNDMQNRQRLKEFMEYQRQGDDQGYWKIRNSDTVPTEDEVRAMITPEDSSLLDSMQYGQQLLDDIAMIYGEKEEPKKDEVKKEKKEKEKDKKEDSTEPNKDDNEDESTSIKKEKEKEKEKEKVRKPRDPDAEIDIDEELAPWNITRNFLGATSSKYMLQLNGEGDPTGVGLGYSLLRSTQKNGFKPLFGEGRDKTPKNNTAAYQQKLYEAEIKRIWYSQRSSLVDHGSDFNLQAIYDEYKPADHERYIKHLFREEKKKAEELAKSKASSENGESNLNVEEKVLRITRRVRDENGIFQRKVETISDPRLINAYIKRKKQIEDELLKNADVTEILPTNDKELNKIRRKALLQKLANLEKRAKQSRAKKPPKDSIHAAAAAGGTIIDANTVMLPDGSYAIGGKGIGKGKSKTRRCASCGAFGHIRTNKSCPLYAATNGGTIPVKRDDHGNITEPLAAIQAMNALNEKNNNPTPNNQEATPIDDSKLKYASLKSNNN
ncbi:uncharacterized protein RJT21DRAFT_135558 [Scheffersomyces amazonensis]|uniref:uncharacterized protein n=1 Tax=Scheffersomyces amazonensis TaxID=1078765 RepID=UPI00315C85E0